MAQGDKLIQTPRICIHLRKNKNAESLEISDEGEHTEERSEINERRNKTPDSFEAPKGVT